MKIKARLQVIDGPDVDIYLSSNLLYSICTNS